MFQRLSNLLFGEVEEVAAELKGPNPCVTEADEEGWMLVNLHEAECVMQDVEETGSPSEHKNSSDRQNAQKTKDCRPPHKRRRTHKSQGSLDSPNSANVGAASPVSLGRQARLSTPSSTPPAPGSECGGSAGSSREGSERGCMDESWFVTPPPCFTAEGATAEASPMEDLLIEHPSMSVYVSPTNMSIISHSDLSIVAEESTQSGANRVTDTAASPAVRSSTRVRRGAATQAGPLAKVTQVARVQRSKACIDRRHLSRNHIQRQNRTREQLPRHASHARNSFLHQPSKRNICH